MNKIAGSKLSEAREAKKYTQDEMAKTLADRLGQSYSTRQYQKLEFGLFPKLKTGIIKEIDDILGSNIYSLVYEQKGRPLPVAKVEKSEIKGKGLSDREILAGLNRGFEAIAETMRSIESKMAREETLAKMETSLRSVLESQDAGFGLVAEDLRLNIVREAKGNQEKVKENLRRIRQKIGPKLGPIAQKGISADEGM